MSFRYLENILKKILILSHGNAFVERGFSINKEIEIENQINRSIVAQKRVYNAVQAVGGLDRVEINKKNDNYDAEFLSRIFQSIKGPKEA